MNERHRCAKAAQKQCTELFMLDLLHKRPHVESALITGIEVRFPSSPDTLAMSCIIGVF